MGWHCFAKKRAVRIVAAVLHYFLCCAVSTKPQKSHFKQRRMWNADSGEFLRKPYFFSNDMKTCKLKRWEKRRNKGQLSHILPASYLYSWNLLEELCKIYLTLGLDAVLQFTLSLKIAGLVPFLLTLRYLSCDLLLSITERSKQQEVGALDRARYSHRHTNPEERSVWCGGFSIRHFWLTGTGAQYKFTHVYQHPLL